MDGLVKFSGMHKSGTKLARANQSAYICKHGALPGHAFAAAALDRLIVLLGALLRPPFVRRETRPRSDVTSWASGRMKALIASDLVQR